MRMASDGGLITVAMGKVNFNSCEIPVTGPEREVIQEQIDVAGEALEFTAASIGNPHCVVVQKSVSEALARRYGPIIEADKRFPNRTNVQFVQVLDRSNIKIEIWERGAGYTLASGSSSCAAAAVAYRLELCDADISVHMPGGEIIIRIEKDYHIEMTGPVTRVCEGFISKDLFS